MNGQEKTAKKNLIKMVELAKIGKTDEIILNQAINNFDNIKNNNNLSFDVKDFDLNFVSGLSMEDGLSTLTDFTATIIFQSITNSINLAKGTTVKHTYLWRR